MGMDRDHRVINSVGGHMEYYGDGMCLELCDGDILLEKLVLRSVNLVQDLPMLELI